MQTNWKPNNSCVLAGVPLAVPSKEQISKLYMLFYSMVGGFAKIVKSNIDETFKLVSEDKKLFKFDVKRRMTEAKEFSDELIDLFKERMKADGMSEIWDKLTFIIKFNLQDDVRKCYYALDNQFLKHHIERHKMYTMAVMSGILSGMLESSVSAFKKTMDEYNGSWATNIAEYFIIPIKGVHSRMRNAVEAIYPESVDKKVFSECPDKLSLGFEIIGRKVLDYKLAEKALANACIFSGLNLDINGIIVDGEDAQDNTGTPWNEAQLRALITGYPDTSNKYIARIVGRSVYEVIKQAKKLGLKKSEEYLRETRIANLKRKKNEKDSNAVHKEQ